MKVLKLHWKQHVAKVELQTNSFEHTQDYEVVVLVMLWGVVLCKELGSHLLVNGRLI
jgi:hypothetical protein